MSLPDTTAAPPPSPWLGLATGTLRDLEDLAHASWRAIARAYSIDPEDPAFLMHLAAKVGEESGEVLGAYLRATGWARRPGSFDDLDEELADVVISAFLVAISNGRNLPAAIERKAEKVFARGWRQDRA
jgi:NTP pyrophosphatase (non-canonical NTP hydrolase)